MDSEPRATPPSIFAVALWPIAIALAAEAVVLLFSAPNVPGLSVNSAPLLSPPIAIARSPVAVAFQPTATELSLAAFAVRPNAVAPTPVEFAPLPIANAPCALATVA